MLFAFELDDRFDRSSAIVFLEEGCLKGLAWHAFEVPGLYNALWAQYFAEFAIEAVLGTVGVYVGEVPSATGAHVHLFDGHFVFSGTHPMDEELGVRVGTEHCFARRIETAFYSDFSVIRCRDYRGFCDRLGGFHGTVYNHIAI